jgi:hypothetical protein
LSRLLDLIRFQKILYWLAGDTAGFDSMEAAELRELEKESVS